MARITPQVPEEETVGQTTGAAESVAGHPTDRSTQLLASAAAGIIIGLLDVVIVLSFASLIFFDEWAVHLPAASAIALVGTAILLGGIALTSSVPGMVGSSQDTAAAVLAVIAASIATKLDAATNEAFLTLVLVMVLSSLGAGIFFFSLGALRLGDLIRYVPHPVIGGFLAATGWLLVKGGLNVLTGLPITLAAITDLAQPTVVGKVLPGAALLFLLLYLVSRLPHPLVLGGTLAATTLGFYVVVFASGNSVADAEAGGWLMGPFPRTQLWQPWVLDAWGGADWSIVAGEAGNLGTLLFIALIGMLLNATGAEVLVGRDADLNQELMSAGRANVAAGLFGAVPGYHALSFCALGHRLGARGRTIGVVAAGVCVGAMFVAPAVLGRTPRFLLGGVLLFLGVSLLIDWLVASWVRLPRLEFGIVATIALTVAVAGFLEGVALGLVLSTLLFVVSYSRTDVAKHELSGANFHSNVERPLQHMDLLRRDGDSIHVLELHGFLFFGTVHRLLQAVMRRAADMSRPPLRYVVIDFRRVTGIDASAIAGIAKIHRLGTEGGFVLVLSGMDRRMRERLERGAVVQEDSLKVFEDIDIGMQWCEDRLFAEIGALPPPSAASSILDDYPEVQSYLERIDVPAGRTLLKAGESSRDVFFLQSGRLAAHIPTDGGTARIRSMGPGTIVGEVGAYLAAARTASVVAEEPSVVYRLALDDLEDASRETAAAVHQKFASVMAERLADNVRLIEALRR